MSSGTIYCCGVVASRSRPKPLVVDDITVTLVNDAHFRQLDRQLQRRPDRVVHATVVGRLFVGKKVACPGGSTGWSGYGHMGCCSLHLLSYYIKDPKRVALARHGRLRIFLR